LSVDGITYFIIYQMILLPTVFRLHDQAGSTSWLYVNWTSQLDVCSIA